MLDINKISIDMINFFEVNGKFDKENRKILFNVSFEQLKTIFNINMQDIFFTSDETMKNTKKIYILCNDEKYYSCLECTFSIHMQNEIVFSSVSVNFIFENILTNRTDIKIKKVTFKSYYIGHSIHSGYIKSFSFYYNYRKKVMIKTYTNENFYIDISVESKNECWYSELKDIIFTIIEIMMLIFGDIPIITDVNIGENQEINAYFEIVDKYKAPRKRSNGKEILGCITEKTLNKDIIKKFENFRKNTKIIYDIYMTTINLEGYKEIKNCNLIQIMEGLYKTLGMPKLELREILIYYFNYSKSSKKLLTRKDKRKVKDPNNTPIFIYKANNHRNYLSHLNLKQNKNVFYQLENIYAYWKLTMCTRIYILEYLSVSYENKKIPKYIKEVDDWAKKNNLRFSARINS